MSWLSNILHGKASITNHPPPVPIPAGGPSTSPLPYQQGRLPIGQTTSPYQMAPTSTQPVLPSYDTGSGSGGVWDWISSHLGDVGGFLKDHAGDILSTGGNVVGGALDYDAKLKALAQQKEQFEKMYGLSANNQATSVASLLNRAPLADKGQYMALNFAAPQAFRPRDYTQGVGQITGAPQGGAAAQVAANTAASANYKAGAGGVNTDTLKMILARINGSVPQSPPVPPSGPFALAPGATYPKDGSTPGPMPTLPAGNHITPQTGGGGTNVYSAWDRAHPGQSLPAITSKEFGDWYKQWQASGGH